MAGEFRVIRIVARHFVAAVVLDGAAVVVRAAPIVRYMTGWSCSRVLDYCQRRHWQPQLML